jgi:hypothetical protein
MTLQRKDTTVRIDHLHISERDRLLAEAYLRKAEGMAEVIYLATQKLQSAAAFLGGSLAALLALSGSRPAPQSTRSPRRA